MRFKVHIPVLLGLTTGPDSMELVQQGSTAKANIVKVRNKLGWIRGHSEL